MKVVMCGGVVVGRVVGFFLFGVVDDCLFVVFLLCVVCCVVDCFCWGKFCLGCVCCGVCIYCGKGCLLD